MTQLYAITSTHNIGGTFLDWSIYWLTGATQFYNIEQGQISLVSSPLANSTTAHNHQKNHPIGVDQCKEAIEILKQVNGLVSIYPCKAHSEQILTKFNINENEFSSNHQFVLSEQKKDYAAIWALLQEENIPIIYIASKNKLYTQIYRSLDVRITKQYEPYADKLDYYKDHASIFFNIDVDLTEIWNLRELIALSIRPFEEDNLDCLVNFSQQHLYINADHLFYDGLKCIINVIDYLGLTVNQLRISAWKEVYYNWQQIQFDILKFSWDLDHICNCIVNNYSCDISKYNLDLLQEATILHILLYKYGLNIKSYRLEKFPNNTQDIHKLLEKNTIHELENIYLQGVL